MKNHLVFYLVEDFSEAVYTMVGHEGTLKLEYDDISMKTKFILKRFGGTFGTLRFDERSFFKSLLHFTPYWDHKPLGFFHGDRPSVYTSDENLKLNP